ncbi:MAG TPA: hypothetical protein VKA35_05915 [Solirubrobacterales bacterium]|nr:hypothetical protein [Solirubrobacterales bacterium]
MNQWLVGVARDAASFYPSWTVSDKAEPKPSDRDPWRVNEEARRRQRREDGQRPLAVNLAEGLALSEFLSTFTGSAKRS